MDRKTKNIKFNNETWKIQEIFPIDFIDCSYFPFTFYVLKDTQPTFKKKEVKRNWNLKPKEKIEEEENLEKSLDRILEIGIVSPAVDRNGSFNRKSIQDIKKDQNLYSILLSEIYALTYSLSSIDKLMHPQMEFSKDFSEAIYIKSKNLGVEPYSFLADLTMEKPGLYNPKRWNFNFFILSVGWDKERREVEEYNKKMNDVFKKTLPNIRKR